MPLPVPREGLGAATRDIVVQMARSARVSLERPPRGQRHAPGPRSLSPLGSLPELSGNPLPALERWFETYGDVVRVRFAASTAYLISHPEGARHVLQENHRNYSKSGQGSRMLGLVLGRGLLTSDGDFWLRQRRIAQPAFHRDRIRGYFDVIRRESERTAQTLSSLPANTERDITDDLMAMTLEIIADCALGVHMTGEVKVVSEAMDFLTRDIDQRIDELTGPLVQLPTKRNAAFFAHLRALDEVVYRIIRERRRGESRDDLLGMLLHARDEDTGEQMSDEQLRDEVITMLLAGHETTSNLLAWTLHLLTTHPEEFAKVQAEVNRVLRDGPVDMESLHKLEATGRALQEALRLYPPAWIIERWADGPDVIGGYPIPADSLVLVSMWNLHRRADFWPEPLAFNPDRFREPLRHRFAFLPFGAGPRLCIGREFALMEARVALACLLRTVNFEAVAGQVVAPEPQVTLRPRNGLRMRVGPRKTASTVG